MDDIATLFTKLKELTDVPSTSGFEQGIAKKVYAEVKPVADQVEVDNFGNVYAYLKGNSDSFRIMLPAHSDSVGMIISHSQTAQKSYLGQEND